MWLVIHYGSRNMTLGGVNKTTESLIQFVDELLLVYNSEDEYWFEIFPFDPTNRDTPDPDDDSDDTPYYNTLRIQSDVLGDGPSPHDKFVEILPRLDKRRIIYRS